MSISKCPLCKSSIIDELFILQTTNFTGSDLYTDIKIYSCKNCKHIFNLLNEDQYKSLAKYKEEIAEIKLNSDNISIKDYDQIYSYLEPFLKKDKVILDIECSNGNFLKYLKKKKYNKLFGVDSTKKYIDSTEIEGALLLNSESIKLPFADKSTDVCIMDQTLSKTGNPVATIREAKRVLDDEGILCISIPNAIRYDEFDEFDYYWFLLRENIQHFDDYHIKLLLESEGFEILHMYNTDIESEIGTQISPNLTLICKLVDREKTKDLNIFNLKSNLENQIKFYLEKQEKELNMKRSIINRMFVLKTPLYVWGAGIEFLYLWKNTNLKFCSIRGIVDDNKYKQMNFSINNKKIGTEVILEGSLNYAKLVITSTYHKNAIEEKIKNSKFNGVVQEL